MKFFWCLMHSISRFYWIRVVVYCGVRTGPLAIAAELCAVLPGNAKSPCKRFSFLHLRFGLKSCLSARYVRVISDEDMDHKCFAIVRAPGPQRSTQLLGLISPSDPLSFDADMIFSHVQINGVFILKSWGHQARRTMKRQWFSSFLCMKIGTIFSKTRAQIITLKFCWKSFLVFFSHLTSRDYLHVVVY